MARYSQTLACKTLLLAAHDAERGVAVLDAFLSYPGHGLTREHSQQPSPYTVTPAAVPVIFSIRHFFLTALPAPLHNRCIDRAYQ